MSEKDRERMAQGWINDNHNCFVMGPQQFTEQYDYLYLALFIKSVGKTCH
jgi:hypothetical protein